MCCVSDEDDSADEAQKHSNDGADKPFFRKESFTKETVIFPFSTGFLRSIFLRSIFDKTFLKSFRRYPGAGDLGLFRMTTTIYGIAMLVAEVGFLRQDVLQTFLSIKMPK